MAATCIPVLNYIAFIILYIISFYMMSVENTTIIGYIVFFVFHASFILYLLSNLMNIFNSYDKNITTASNGITYFVLFSVLFTCVFHLIDIILIIMSLTYLRTKKYNNSQTGDVDPQTKQILGSFNYYTMCIFVVCVLLLGMFFYDVSGYTFLPFKFYNANYVNIFFNDPSVTNVSGLVAPFCALFLAIFIDFASYYQFDRANSISKLYSRSMG
jgi:hypothetical protein